MIEYTAINYSDNQIVITMENKFKDILNNIDFEFKIINEIWYAHDGFETIPYNFEPSFPYGDLDYEVTLKFKSKSDRDFFDYIFGTYCNNVDKLEYALEVAV